MNKMIEMQHLTTRRKLDISFVNSIILSFLQDPEKLQFMFVPYILTYKVMILRATISFVTCCMSY